MPFVWQTKFHKVSIKSIINIISLSNLGFGSDFLKFQIRTETVLERNCPRPKLSKTAIVQNQY